MVRRRISALIWDISGLWNPSDVQDYREKWIVISRFLELYNFTSHNLIWKPFIIWTLLYRFLRGGIEADILNIEEDTLQEHVHFHSLNDPGHSHGYNDLYPVAGNDGPGLGWYGQANYNRASDHRRASESAKTYLQLIIDGVSGARASTETRPKNMRVVYIMKVC